MGAGLMGAGLTSFAALAGVLLAGWGLACFGAGTGASAGSGNGARTRSNTGPRQMASKGCWVLRSRSMTPRSVSHRKTLSPSVSRCSSRPRPSRSARRRPNSRRSSASIRRMRCRLKPRRRRSLSMESSARSSAESSDWGSYRESKRPTINCAKPWRAGVTIRCSSHHCSCRGVSPVRCETWLDVKLCFMPATHYRNMQPVSNKTVNKCWNHLMSAFAEVKSAVAGIIVNVRAGRAGARSKRPGTRVTEE